MKNINYKNFINVLIDIPNKEKYLQNDLLINDLLIMEENKLQMYYAPLDYINIEAKIVIVGITPGFTQMEKAIRTLKQNYNKKKIDNEILMNVKSEAAFVGKMRKNLVQMLDEIELAGILKLNTCEQLFNCNNNLLTHMTSLLKYPVFKNKKNYTGRSPFIFNSKMLMNMVENIFLNEIKNIKYNIMIPLGTTVSNILRRISVKDLNMRQKCLFDFPHPSGANGHRVKIFSENRERYKEKIKELF